MSDGAVCIIGCAVMFIEICAAVWFMALPSLLEFRARRDVWREIPGTKFGDWVGIREGKSP